MRFKPVPPNWETDASIDATALPWRCGKPISALASPKLCTNSRRRERRLYASAASYVVLGYHIRVPIDNHIRVPIDRGSARLVLICARSSRAIDCREYQTLRIATVDEGCVRPACPLGLPDMMADTRPPQGPAQRAGIWARRACRAAVARHNTTNSTCAAICAVLVVGSYWGAISTTSPPTTSRPRQPLRIAKASTELKPPTSGVPVPGAKAGSRPSMSKVT